jgi:UDPglucose 6-dehydrogenase
MRHVVIVGYGVVGRNMHKIFPEAEVYDPPQEIFAIDMEYDVAFVCVPTPKLENDACDISFVTDAVLRGVKAKTFCIKSAVPPGTCRRLAAQTESHIVCSPEYFGETQHNQNLGKFVILGGHWVGCAEVAELYKTKATGELEICNTTWETAELVKYMENAFLAAKVTFCCEFYRLAESLCVNYDELRELWLKDPRIGRSHTFVYRDHPYYESKCLDKDVPAIVRFAYDRGIRMELLKSVIQTNAEHKEWCDE